MKKRELAYRLESIVELVRPEEVTEDAFVFELPLNFHEFIADGNLYVRIRKPRAP